MKILLVILLFILTGCVSKSLIKENATPDKLVKGMSRRQVVGVLGRPSFVSTDAEARKVWVYYKFSDYKPMPEAGMGKGLLVHRGTRYSMRKLKPLTLIINFDKKKRVRSFVYHKSRPRKPRL